LEEHGTYCIRGRFDELPIHQTYFQLNDTNHTNDDSINYFQHSIHGNGPSLLQVDIMGMTPLHILRANPTATKDTIKQLYSKNTITAAVRNVNEIL
jgi:hypothetical protein